MEAHREGSESSVQVELRGLSIYTHHGVSDAEQEVGQRLVIDVSFDVPDCDAVLTDRLEDTIDYAEVADIVALAATERSYRTLERLARRDRRAADGALRLRRGARARGQARAADPARDRGGRGRGRARAGARGARRGGGRARGQRRDARATWGSARTSATALGHLRAAVAALGEHGVEVEALSSVYETEPVGEILDQPDFLNAAVRIETELEPRGAARRLQGDRGRAGPDVRRAQARPAAARRRPAAARRAWSSRASG